MQQFPHRQSSSNTPVLLAAAVGLGALLAYALASPRRRSALVAAGHSALEAGSRLAATSAERLQEWMPERLQEPVDRLATHAAGDADSVMSAAAGKLHNAVDVASELMHRAVARARRLPAAAERGTRAAVHQVSQAADTTLHGVSAGRSSALVGSVIAAAALGAGLYAMRRHGEAGGEQPRSRLDDGAFVLDKTLFIDAPIDQVFDTWSSYENFSQFMSNVESVQPLEGNRSHWKIRGPAGIAVEFDSVAYQQRPNQIRWHSEPGSTVENSGRVTLTPENGGTRVQVHLSYRPPAGQVGQTVSSWLGADPLQEFEEDLNRMKQFVEGQRAGTFASSGPGTSNPSAQRSTP